MKQPQFDKLTLQTPLWRDNAEALRTMRAARHARIHKNSFPVLVILFGIAVARLIVWWNSLP